MYLYSIMPLDIDHVDEICQDIQFQYENGIADLVLFSMTLVPEGEVPVPKAEILCEKYDIFRDRLASMGLKCGILAQATIGHGYKLNHKFGFQSYVNLTDGEEQYVCCPADLGFQEHMQHTFAVLASHRPEIIMVDDDFRLIQRAGKGCTCPLHMEAYQKLAGTQKSREELWRAAKGTTLEDKKIRDMFVQTQIDSLIACAKAMRRGIDSVDSTIPGEYCTCEISAEGAVEIATILAGEGNPVVIRVNNGNYTPQGARFLTRPFQCAAIEIAVMRAQGKVDAFLAETDTCPQNRYSTGAYSLHSHFTGTILEGVAGAKHWITRLAEYESESGKAYREVLGKYSGFYRELSRIVPTLSWLGCRIPVSTVPDYGFRESFAINHWVVCVLERLGLPVYFSEKQGGAVFMERENHLCFTDEELKEMLSGTVVLDGYAAKGIQDRGLGRYLGAEVRKWDGVRLSRERVGAEGRKVSPQIGAFQLIPFEGTKCDSMVYHIPDGKSEIPLFPGTVISQNELGGTVIIFGGLAKTNFVYTEAFSFLNATRKKQFVKILSETGNLPLYYPGDAEVYLRVADTADGGRFCAFFNIGFDPIEQITLVSDREVGCIQELLPDGSRRECKFEHKDGVLEIHVPAYTLQPVILFLY